MGENIPSNYVEYDTLAKAIENVTPSGMILCSGGKCYVGISPDDYGPVSGISETEITISCKEQEQDEFETPADAEFLIILEQAIDDIDGLIEIIHVSPHDAFGQIEASEAYKSYATISKRIYAMRNNRCVEQNKPDDK